MEKFEPAEGDQRFYYVNFKDLKEPDKRKARSSYQNNAYLPTEEYLYPIKTDGSLANARRVLPQDRFEELFRLYQVQLVHDE